MKKLLLLLALSFNVSADCISPDGYTNKVEGGVVSLPHMYHRGKVYNTTLISENKDDEGHRIWTIDKMKLACGFSSSTLNDQGISISLLSYNGSIYTAQLSHSEKGFIVSHITEVD